MSSAYRGSILAALLGWILGESAIASAGIAAAYPGDAGIEDDPRVVFGEGFESGALSDLNGRWDQVLNRDGMSFVGDVPAGSRGTRALRMTTGGTSTSGGHLYTRLPSGHERVYFRYYVRYGSGTYHHAGGWIGGFNPPSPWLQGGSGERPIGNERFTVAFEPQADGRLDFYNYYMEMRGLSNGQFWGNSFLQNPNVRLRHDQWICIELMVKMNNPLAARNGELAVWVDGKPIVHLGPGYPTGTWGPGIWTPSATGQPFEGFRWRNDSSLNLNFIWLLYYTTANPSSLIGRMDWDHVVVATEYIGPIDPGGGQPNPTSPPPAPFLLD